MYISLYLELTKYFKLNSFTINNFFKFIKDILNRFKNS